MLRARRDAFRIDQSGARIPLHGPLVEAIRRATIVAGYVAIGSETDVLPLLHHAAESGRVVALPVVTSRTDPMRFGRWRPGDTLFAGPFGLLQPDTGAEAVAPDLILTPLLGFDRAGARIGQGAGFYDRAFTDLPAGRRVGIGWSVQEVDRLAPDPWDVPLHAVATEREWIEAA